MYEGEAELRAKRKTLSLLTDEARKVVEGVRIILNAYTELVNGNKDGVKNYIEEAKKVEDEVERYRRSLIRELMSMGNMILNREDVLRSAFSIEDIVDYVYSITFRLGQVDPSIFKKYNVEKEVEELILMSIDVVQKMSEVVRMLTINPQKVPEIALEVENIEKQIDEKYRTLSMRLPPLLSNATSAFLLLDILDRIENLSDACLRATDAVTILALGI
jgi:predicted phosphate transport protein (TIGR00153 family)